MSLIYQLLYCSEDYHQKKINVHTLKATWLSLTKKQKKKKILKEILNMHTKKKNYGIPLSSMDFINHQKLFLPEYS